MKKSLSFWQTVGFLFTSVTGTLLHFLYDLTNQSVIVAPFSAVNESVWEHMKLLFFPMFIFAIFEKRFVSEKYKNFWCAKLAGTLTGLFVIPVIFYTYTGALGVKADWFNIAIFFIAASSSYFNETVLLKRVVAPKKSSVTCVAVLVIIALAFVAFTFLTPHIPLFQDSVTGAYGINF